MNRLLIAGSRLLQLEDLTPSRRYAAVLALQHKLSNASYVFDTTFERVIHGGARGVDTIGGLWAEKRGYPVDVYPASWSTYGKRAGFLRNQQMVQDCTHAIVVWDGVSRGTRHTMNLLETSGKPHVVVNLGEDYLQG